jgi:hypothetical protein
VRRIALGGVMKPQLSLALVTLVGFGIGAATVQILHAQAKPPAYLISDVTVTDEEAYKEYV